MNVMTIPVRGDFYSMLLGMTINELSFSYVKMAASHPTQNTLHKNYPGIEWYMCPKGSYNSTYDIMSRVT